MLLDVHELQMISAQHSSTVHHANPLSMSIKHANPLSMHTSHIPIAHKSPPSQTSEASATSGDSWRSVDRCAILFADICAGWVTQSGGHTVCLLLQ